MTIQEAIKTGKPFKRKGDSERDWLEVFGEIAREIRYCDPKERERSSCGHVPLWEDDFLATDWEVKA